MSNVSSDGRSLSFVDLMDICDNFHYAEYKAEPLITWRLTPSPNSPAIGLLQPAIVDQLKKENSLAREKGQEDVWLIHKPTLSCTPSYISFNTWVDTPSKRTSVMKELCGRWRDLETFKDVCGPKKWRGEMYPVYSDPFGIHDYPSREEAASKDTLNYAFEMERSVCALFGVVTYGVHMTIYTEVKGTEATEATKLIWVSRRSATKQTWPGFLDNSVAGGIPSGISPFDSLMKESTEEASIEEDVIRKHAKAVGAVSYFLRTRLGWLQPEFEYAYDLCIPPDLNESIKPKPRDGEVESFELVPLDDVITKLRAGLFKPNCALIMIDFLVRHGHLTAENEPDYLKILNRLHGDFDYKWW